MKFKLVLIVATVYFAGCAFAQTTDAPESDKSPTCPPEPTCPPVEPEKCTCPPVVECPTTESTRTRTRTRGPSRTPRTQERTNSTDTDRSRSRPGPGGRSRTDTRRDQTRTDERSNRTRTDTHRTRPRRRLPKPPRDCTPRLPPGCKDYIATTGPLIFTTGIVHVHTKPPRSCSSTIIIILSYLNC